MNSRNPWFTAGTLALGIGLLIPSGAQAASFGGDRAAQATKMTPELAEKMLAEWRDSGADSRTRASVSPDSSSVLALTTYATAALCNAAMSTPVVEDFDSTLRLSSAWGCGGVATSSAGGGCYNNGDLVPGIQIQGTTGSYGFVDGTMGWSPSDGVSGASNQLEILFTVPTNTVCLDMVKQYAPPTSGVVTVDVLNAALVSQGTASCTLPTNNGSCFVGFTAPADIARLRWTNTNGFDGTHHMSFGKAGAPPTTGCDLAPIEAKLDDGLRWTNDAERNTQTTTINNNTNASVAAAQALIIQEINQNEVKIDKLEVKADAQVATIAAIQRGQMENALLNIDRTFQFYAPLACGGQLEKVMATVDDVIVRSIACGMGVGNALINQQKCVDAYNAGEWKNAFDACRQAYRDVVTGN